MTKKLKRKSPIDAFLALSDEAKAAAVMEFDAPSDKDHGFAALSPKSQKLWQRAKRRRGRPRIGAGATKVLVSVERGLLRRADAFAKREGISRSQLFARGLEAMVVKRRRAG